MQICLRWHSLKVDTLSEAIIEEEHELKLLPLPKDTDDARNAILEVRAGTGGEEAALFASDLFGMYQRFAAKYGWRLRLWKSQKQALAAIRKQRQLSQVVMCLHG